MPMDHTTAVVKKVIMGMEEIAPVSLEYINRFFFFFMTYKYYTLVYTKPLDSARS